MRLCLKNKDLTSYEFKDLTEKIIDRLLEFIDIDRKDKRKDKLEFDIKLKEIKKELDITTSKIGK